MQNQGILEKKVSGDSQNEISPETDISESLFKDGEIITDRKCFCGCGRSLKGFHPNRLYHPDCEDRVDQERRKKRKETIKTLRRQKFQEEFEEFNRRHPEVLAICIYKARQVKQIGYKRYGFRTIWENARWDIQIQKDGDYKMNDHLAPYFARHIMQTCPDLRGFFETRG